MNERFPLLFEDYATSIGALPVSSAFAKSDLLTDQFLVFKHGDLKIYYAPFDFVNDEARVAIVGITPGWHQMEIGYRTASMVLRKGGTPPDALQAAKAEASFAGPMRKILVKMLNDIGLDDALGLKSCDELFGIARHLVHTTSVVRHPVFVCGKNYTGRSPALLTQRLLSQYANDVLAPELTSLSNALVIPLGDCVDAVIGRLIATGELNANRCLVGFPHPSGANGRRHKKFAEARARLTDIVRTWATRSNDLGQNP